MTETNTPAPSAPQTQTPRTDTLWSQIEHTPSAFEMAALTRTLELESAARQRVIDAIERECQALRRMKTITCAICHRDKLNLVEGVLEEHHAPVEQGGKLCHGPDRVREEGLFRPMTSEERESLDEFCWKDIQEQQDKSQSEVQVAPTTNVLPVRYNVTRYGEMHNEPDGTWVCFLDFTSERAAREAAEKARRDIHVKLIDLLHAFGQGETEEHDGEKIDEMVIRIATERDELRSQLAEMKEKACVLESQVENADVNLEQVKMNAKAMWRTKLESCEKALAEMTASRDALDRHHDISECPKGHKFRTIASHPAKSEREWECPHCAVAERDAALARVEQEKREKEFQAGLVEISVKAMARVEADLSALRAESVPRRLVDSLANAARLYLNRKTGTEVGASQLNAALAGHHEGRETAMTDKQALDWLSKQDVCTLEYTLPSGQTVRMTIDPVDKTTHNHPLRKVIQDEINEE